jgi:putative mRNA 3-end processing factor
VLATEGTLAIMRARFGAEAGGTQQPASYGEVMRIGEVDVSFVPAGHILGSAQIVMEYRGSRVVVSGDYKRRADATCLPFEPQRCDVFITEATFGLPVFRRIRTRSHGCSIRCGSSPSVARSSASMRSANASGC